GGAYLTEFTIEFPWTISKAELLDWFAPKFTASGKLGVNGRKLSYEAPLDDGFIIRVTPLFKGN
ncbi:MAG: hypothetical protein FJ088_12250, partial [Deltaproteobacteria bacterium]|nr:hypothetical protein [Deltaproteobacteria bacterium]